MAMSMISTRRTTMATREPRVLYWFSAPQSRHESVCLAKAARINSGIQPKSITVKMLGLELAKRSLPVFVLPQAGHGLPVTIFAGVGFALDVVEGDS